MSNIPGFALQNIILIVASYLLVLLVNKKTRSDSALLLVAILTFHHVVAYLYAFHLSFPENEVDPATFLLKAEKCINFDYCGYLGHHLYVSYLAKMLELGGSLYFVFLMNVLYFVISIYFFIGIAELLGLQGNRKEYLFLYGMWPSVIYFTTMHYREPFELYLLIAGIFFGLLGTKKNSFIILLVSSALLFIMGLFHIKGLLFLSPFLFLIVTANRMPFNVISIVQRISLVVVMGVGSYYSYNMYTPDIMPESSINQDFSVADTVEDKVNKIIDDKAVSEPAKDIDVTATVGTDEVTPEIEINYIEIMVKKIMLYRSILLGEREVRTAFISKINDENTIIFILTFFFVYVEYLFAPFIFQVNTFNEFIAYAESVLRLILFISSLILLRRVPQSRVLFIIFLAITSMWTIGVVSFGASIRHHIQTNWILVLLGVPVISEYLRKKVAERKGGNGKVLS